MYVALTKYLGLIIQLVITGVLSRLLTPDDYGLVAITSVFVIFFGLFADMGIGPAIVQRHDLEEEDMQSIFTFTCCMGIGLGILFFAIAPLISSFYERPELLNMCRILSLGILFSCMNIIPNSLLMRNKMFKFLMYRQLVIQIFSGIAGIIAALAGWGVYALLVNYLMFSFLTFLVNYIRSPISPRKIHNTSLKKIARFSAYQFLFNFVNYFSRNLDNLLIGKYLSSLMLGYYEKSYKLMLLPVQNLTHVLSPAILPYFSDYQNDKQRIFSMYLKIVKILALVGFPLSVFLHFTASELILIIFGSQWLPSVPVFEILAWSVGIQVVVSSSGAVFQAANDTRLLFIGGFFSAIMMVSAICIGVFIIRTIEGVAISLCYVFLLNFFLNYFLLVKITLKSSLCIFLKVMSLPILMALGIFVLEYALCFFVTINNVFLSLLLKALVASSLYFPVVYPIARKEYLSMKFSS